MYVIKRSEDGRYVAAPGSVHSYTPKLESARIFPTREAAERDCCGNERAYQLQDLLEGRAAVNAAKRGAS